MPQPKFKTGDKVLHKRTGRILTIVDVRYQRAVVTQAIICRENETSAIEPTTINEYYSYRLNDGKSWRYAENLLEKV